MRHNPVLGAILLVGLVFPAPVHPQDQELSRLRVRRATGELVELRSGRLTSTTLLGRLATGETVEIPRSEIRELYVVSGTHALKGAALGAGSGLLTLGLALLEIESDPLKTTRWDRVPVLTAVLVGGGGAVGAVIGNRMPRWRRMTLEPAAGPVGEDGKARLALTIRIR